MALKDNLVSYWKMEEASGNRADAHGSNTLTDNNTVTSGTGKIDTAADFERTNSERLTIADASQTGLDFTGDFSASVWVNLEAALDGTLIEYNLISKYRPTGNQRSYSFNYTWNGGTPRLQFVSSTNGAGASVGSANVTLSAATWYHLVFIYTASAGSVEFFVDGSSIGSDTALGTSIFNGTADFEIGAQNAAFFVDGLIDEVAVWSRVITSDEVAEIYNSGAGKSYDDWDVAASPRTTQPTLLTLGVG